MKRLLATALFAASGCGGSQPAPLTATPIAHRPLLLDGAPIGEVSGELDPASDEQRARFTGQRTAVVIHLDKAPSRRLEPPRVPIEIKGIDRADRAPDGPAICFDHSVLPVDLRALDPTTPSPKSFVVSGKTFIVDSVELCLANGDVATPFLSFNTHWDAPDGTRIIVEGGFDPPMGIRFRSIPPKPEKAILAALLF